MVFLIQQGHLLVVSCTTGGVGEKTAFVLEIGHLGMQSTVKDEETVAGTPGLLRFGINNYKQNIGPIQSPLSLV